MTPELPIEFTVTSARQIQAAAMWWIENRPSAPKAFGADLERALTLIRLQPLSGALAASQSLAGVRRINLPRIRYRLYYRMIDAPPRLQVLAFWHASRGSEPELS